MKSYSAANPRLHTWSRNLVLFLLNQTLYVSLFFSPWYCFTFFSVQNIKMSKFISQYKTKWLLFNVSMLFSHVFYKYTISHFIVWYIKKISRVSPVFNKAALDKCFKQLTNVWSNWRNVLNIFCSPLPTRCHLAFLSDSIQTYLSYSSLGWFGLTSYK